MSKRILSVFIALLLMASILVSCARELPDPAGSSEIGSEQEESVADAESDTESESIAESESEEETEPPIPTEMTLFRDGEVLCTVILAEELSDATRSYIEQALLRLGNALETVIPVAIDSETEPAEGEILIGLTDREESRTASEDLRAEEWRITCFAATQRLAVAGGSEEAILRALESILLEGAPDDEGTVTLPDGEILAEYCDLPLRQLTVQGVDLTEFSVIIPKLADLSTHYAARNLVDYFEECMEVSLPILTDDNAATEHEILIGKTNRPESSHLLTLGAGEFLLTVKNGKPVMNGEGIWVGGAVGTFINDYVECKLNRDSLVGATVRIGNLNPDGLKQTFVFPETYTSAILMIGDGMGFNHVGAALANGLDSFVAEQLPVSGSSVTRSQSVLDKTATYTDSAAAATALATGYKTVNGYVGVDSNNVSLYNVRELAHDFGARTAVVTTDVITGATPAGFLCHHNNRNSTALLQTQIGKLITDGDVDFCSGEVGDSLTNQTRKALLTVSAENSPFFLMVEEAYIDKNSHSNNMSATVSAVKRFNTAIAYVIQFVLCHPDTVLIITADHETGGITESSGSFSFTSGNHTNANVPLYAMGPGTEMFDNLATENTLIPYFIAKAYGSDRFGDATYLPAAFNS